MVLTVDQQVEVLTLVVSNEALGASHFLLLVCKGLRQDAAEVMPAFAAKPGLQWTSIISVLQNFPKAKRLSFFNQLGEGAFVRELIKGRDLHTLDLTECEVDVSALAGCASLHTLIITYCSGVTDVSALAGCASLHTLDLGGCSEVKDVSALAGRASLQIVVEEEGYWTLTNWLYRPDAQSNMSGGEYW